MKLRAGYLDRCRHSHEHLIYNNFLFTKWSHNAFEHKALIDFVFCSSIRIVSPISRAHVPGYKIWDLNKVIIIIMQSHASNM